jgi:hypothetical protein
MVIGKLDLQNQQENRHLLCIEMAQLPFEAILVARGVSCLLRQTKQPKQSLEFGSSDIGRQSSDQKNFEDFSACYSCELHTRKIELPKSSVLGIGEKVSEFLIAAINDNYTEQPEYRPNNTRVDPGFR